jgi:hypothetical protein
VSMIQLLELGSVPALPLKSSDHCKVKPEMDGTATEREVKVKAIVERKLVARMMATTFFGAELKVIRMNRIEVNGA